MLCGAVFKLYQLKIVLVANNIPSANNARLQSLAASTTDFSELIVCCSKRVIQKTSARQQLQLAL